MTVAQRWAAILGVSVNETKALVRDGYADKAEFLKAIKALDVPITAEIITEVNRNDVRITEWHVRDEFATFTSVVKAEGAQVNATILNAVDIGAHITRERKETVAGTTIFEAWGKVGVSEPGSDEGLLNATGSGDVYSKLIDVLARKVTPAPEVPSG